MERRFRSIFSLTFLLNSDEKLCVVKISSPVNVGGGGAGTGICSSRAVFGGDTIPWAVHTQPSVCSELVEVVMSWLQTVGVFTSHAG